MGEDMNQLDERTSMSLGDRIILAARLAVAEHLGQSMAQQDGKRQVAIGGAGPSFVGPKWVAESNRANRDGKPGSSVSVNGRFADGDVG
jgi:hypothetical protein